MEKTKRSPVVVVMGHVDNGKTTLLDAIRKTDVAGREFGGITQSIGAYQASGITFIDTPGHEAFGKMRSRGVNVADIAILVVAANDSVMPQTIESINIILEAKIPFIVAINKVDLPESNVDKVIKDLLRYNVLLENYGGNVPFVKISAKKNEGVKELLELINLLWEMRENKEETLDLKAVIIESKMDKNRGLVATAIVKSGELTVGQKIFIGNKEHKIRMLFDYNEKQISKATSGMPVLILGLTDIVPVGAEISSVAASNSMISKPTALKHGDNLLNLIIRADTLGSLEAIIPKLPSNVNVLESGTGEVTNKDILLAKTTKAVVVGFNVKTSVLVVDLAKTEKVILRSYKIIYELLEELTDAAAGALDQLVEEEVLGVGLIVAQFPYEKLKIAGVKVTDGRLARGDKLRIGETESKIKELRVGREQANKVEKGKECGVLLDPQLDFKLGESIIAHS